MADVVRVMTELRVGALIVKKEGSDAVAGMVTSDQLTRLLSRILDDPEQDLDTRMRFSPICEVMASAATMASVAPEDSVESCITLMKERGLRHLPVLEADGSIVGVISLKDILVLIQGGYLCPKCCEPLLPASGSPRGVVWLSRFACAGEQDDMLTGGANGTSATR